MARQHGKDVQVYLDERDLSGDLAQIDVRLDADVHEVTNFASAGWKEGTAGLLGWSAAFQGFYDPAAAGYGRQMESLLGASCDALSVYEVDADAIGDTGILLGAGVVKLRDQPIPVADMIKLNGDMEGHGRAGVYGKLLHVKAERTGSGQASSLDNSGSTANGGRGNLHVTACSGLWTIYIQHSANNVDWANLVTFAAATAATGESQAVTGTVNRYLRVEYDLFDSGSITFVCGFARY